MRKTQSQQPLMVAYIIFLATCCCYHVVAEAFKLEFPAWQRIIAAATIASYFFSLCSSSKQTLKISKMNLENILEQNELYRKILQKEEKLHIDKEKSIRMADYLKRQLNENQEEAKKEQNTMSRVRKIVFWLDVAGFLVFFCIISFDWLYSFFAKSLGWYTLLAFIMMLFAEYLESTKVSYYGELCKSSTDSLKEILALLEVQDNG